MKKIIIIFISLFIATSSLAENFGVISIMYHRVGEAKYPSTNVSPEMFKEHLRLIEESKIPYISPNDFKSYILGELKLDQRKILFTVDDAFKSFYDNAWPLLKEKKIPFILFVNTREINQKHSNYMNWDQIRELKNSGLVTIGGHSWSHDYFVNMKLEDIEKDIKQSQKDYERELKSISDIYAHTFGETNKDIINLLKKYNYKILFGQHSGVISLNENLSFLPRFSLNENYGKIERFKNILRAEPFNLKSYEPKVIMLNKDNNPTNLKISFNEKVKGINCFDNSGGKWQNTKINFITPQDIELSFSAPFKPRRGRLNCTLPSSNKKIKWFGYQYSVLN